MGNDRAACAGEVGLLLGVNVHQLELKVADALLGGRLKHECHGVTLILCLQCDMRQVQADARLKPEGQLHAALTSRPPSLMDLL